MLLAGDIGGTRTRLAVFSAERGVYAPLCQKVVLNRNFTGIEPIIRQFLTETGITVERACLGVAGPVRSGRAQITNLPWRMDEQQLKEAFGLRRVDLINDLEAIAYAIPQLQATDVEILQAGKRIPTKPIAVIAPGTGLGEAYLTWNGQRYQAHGSEGGHADFAPTDQLQAALLAWLADQFEHVSYERVCSGSGIPNIYHFLKTQGHAEESESWRQTLALAADPAAAIVENALDAERCCDICRKTLDLFTAILGAEAGNLALKISAAGGVYLGGGIPPKILSRLKSATFLTAFRRKGRMQPILATIPVCVILHPEPALLGAACFGSSDSHLVHRDIVAITGK